MLWWSLEIVGLVVVMMELSELHCCFGGFLFGVSFLGNGGVPTLDAGHLYAQKKRPNEGIYAPPNSECWAYIHSKLSIYALKIEHIYAQSWAHKHSKLGVYRKVPNLIHFLGHNF